MQIINKKHKQIFIDFGIEKRDLWIGVYIGEKSEKMFGGWVRRNYYFCFLTLLCTITFYRK